MNSIRAETAPRQPFLDLPPLSGVAGTVRLPGSKSISNRVLLLAGLCAGTTEVRDLLDSDDTRVMLDALAALGCNIVRLGADSVRVQGLDGRLRVPEAQLFLGNAGTAMRPLAAALAVLSTLQGGRFELAGVARMHERPIGDLVNALRPLGCRIECLGSEGYPPLLLSGLAGGTLALDAPVRVRGDVSSQFLTALLMALPLAAATRAVSIEVEGELISRPYIEITLKLLARFGITVQREAWQRFTIPAGSVYRSPGTIHVEGDASSASYFIAAGAIAAIDAPLRIEGVGAESIQGDIRFIDAARAMGAIVEAGPNWLEVRRGEAGQGWPLRPIDLDANHIPDAAMTLAMMALYAEGRTRLRNIASWRVKETDRISAMATELRKFGAKVDEGEDWLSIEPPRLWQAAAIHTYDDHRMAMCASLAAFNGLAGTAPAVPVRVLDPGCVAKTYPSYFDALLAVSTTDPSQVPVITVDGPTASGKGTLSSRLATALGYHHLDSGALYRATALAALDAGVNGDDETALAALARALPIRFEQQRVLLAGIDVSERLREERVGLLASQISTLPAVRAALVELQWSFRQAPGLVADGRDMGTVIFPAAALKVFLTANAAQRAERRHKQLISKGISARLDSLRADLEARDARDMQRATAPLRPAQDARLLDNSALSIEASIEQVLAWWETVQPFTTR
ncbi:MAG: hypothetical protein RLZZ598_1255 [Pseudomonadota bacterium]|jgi:3-phosphoshikimate 1-carboxyvinyltransferase